MSFLDQLQVPEQLRPAIRTAVLTAILAGVDVGLAPKAGADEEGDSIYGRLMVVPDDDFWGEISWYQQKGKFYKEKCQTLCKFNITKF